MGQFYFHLIILTNIRISAKMNSGRSPGHIGRYINRIVVSFLHLQILAESDVRYFICDIFDTVTRTLPNVEKLLLKIYSIKVVDHHLQLLALYQVHHHPHDGQS